MDNPSIHVYPTIEYRSDNPNLKGYRVYYNKRGYLLYYLNDTLREVYFFGFENPDYFMSCRTDMKTISHYFNSKDHRFIKRYEEGKLNRVYRDENNGTVWYEENGKRVVYQLYDLTESLPELKNKLYKDLTEFLDKFYAMKLDELFNPIEPLN